MATESAIGNRRGARPVAVAPAPTFAGWRAARGFDGSLFRCIALLMAMTSALAHAQDRSVSGRISSIPAVVAEPAPLKGLPQSATAGDKQNGVANSKTRPPEGKVKVRSKVKQAVKPKTELKARAGIKRAALSKRPLRHEPVAEPMDRSARMEECRQQIRSVLQPSRLIKLADECEREFPASQFAGEIQHIAKAARQALEIQRVTGLSGDFFEDSVGDEAYRDNLGKAVRGDRDAAYRIALAYRAATSGVAASSRRMEQWLRFSAELGSGQASWELAEFYNYGGFVADAARFEKKALDLGYRPPFRLPTRGY